VHPVGYLLWLFRHSDWWWTLIGTGTIVLLLWASLLAHEWAHILAARWFGVGARRVVLTPVGAFAELDSMPRGLAEFWVALAGPVCSGVLAAFFGGIYLVIPMSPDSWWHDAGWVCVIGCVINASLAGFNLLPCYPMDGGRMLRALLAFTLAKCFRRRRERMHLLASRIVIRYVVPVIVLSIAAMTILLTHVWIHLLLFPLLWLGAELEYGALRDEMKRGASEEGERRQLELPGLVCASAVDERAGSVHDAPRRLRAEAWTPLSGESGGTQSA
jgi:Zn-dependent protease